MSGPRLTVDGRELHALPGENLMDLLRRSGIEVPGLCARTGIEPLSACMLCLVECGDRLVPACSRLSEEGMEVGSSGERVMAARKGSLDFLAGEHAGDCEAPCSLSCPSGLDVEALHLLASTGQLEEAGRLIDESMEDTSFCLTECRAYCETSCRRKVLGSIVETRKLIALLRPWKGPGAEKSAPRGSTSGARGKGGPWRSVIRDLRPEEAEGLARGAGELRAALRANMPEARGLDAIEQVVLVQDALASSASCLICGCARKADCDLRSLVGLIGTPPPRRGRRLEAERETLILEAGLALTVERGKCVKCGICVRESAGGEFPLGFEKRGFDTRVEGFALYRGKEGFVPEMERIVPLCPTGALFLRRKA